VFAVLDLFTNENGAGTDPAGAALGLFFHLTSGAATYAPSELAAWLAGAGFEPPKRIPIRRNPAQTLYRAVRR
jgi:hypothetical protein